jgi:hypothetical protein
LVGGVLRQQVPGGTEDSAAAVRVEQLPGGHVLDRVQPVRHLVEDRYQSVTM